MKSHTRIFLAFCVIAATRANADTLSYGVQDTGSLLTEFNNVPLTLNLFDSNLGTLTGVNLTITGATSAYGTLTNGSSTPQSFSFKQDSAFSLTDNSGSALDTELQNISVDPSVLKNYSNLAGSGVANYGTFSTPLTKSASTSITDNLPLFEAVGGGTDTLYVNTLTGDTFIGGGGNITQNITTNADAQIQVTYTYTPIAVPEPSSMVLVAGALGAFCFRRRR